MADKKEYEYGVVPDSDMPRFPDGSYFEEVRQKPDQAALCKGILDSFNEAYQFGPEHTLSIRIILQTTLAWDKLIKDSDDPKRAKEASALSKDLIAFQDKLGLLRKTGSGHDPFSLWEEHVRTKAIPYMRQHGLGTTVACPECGTFVLPYIQSLPVVCGKCKERVFYHGFKHPWINWDRYPIWSDELWVMMNSPCGHTCKNCGTICEEPKITRQEASAILHISESGMDQLEQIRIDGTILMIDRKTGQLIIQTEIKQEEMEVSEL